MLNHQGNGISRRSFIQGTGALAAGTLLGKDQRVIRAAETVATGPLPRRVLGKTKQEVPVLALGTWPSGMCQTVDTRQAIAIVKEAVDLGVNYIDTAHNYNKAEECIGKALGKQRDLVFLTTKVWADDAVAARKSLDESLRILRTDHVDLVFLHSVGNRDVERATGPDGTLSYLLRAKAAGKARFVGLSGHSRAASFVPVIERGDIDVVMTVMNFVDRYTYGFENTVLPVARQHNLGIACMKVFGGIRGGFAAAKRPNPGPQMETQYLQQAINYSLSLPGVATLVIGAHTVEQLRQNVQMVKNFKPLTDDDRAELARIGRQLAPQWGPRHGPVV